MNDTGGILKRTTEDRGFDNGTNRVLCLILASKGPRLMTINRGNNHGTPMPSIIFWCFKRTTVP